MKRGPKRKADQQQSSHGRSQRDRRLSTSSSSEGDSDDGECVLSSSSSSSSGSEDEAEKEPAATSVTTKEPEKKVIEKPLSSPPSCRAAATAAGPKIASAFRADRTNTNQTSSNEIKTTKPDLAKDKKKEKEKEKDKKEDKDITGTKRKAEVLSDNGRVGVTISTTSLDRTKSPKSPNGQNGSSPMSPTAKVPRLAPPTTPTSAPIDITLSTAITKEPHVTLSISLSPNGEAVARPGLDWREKSNQQHTPQKERSLSQDEQSAKVALLSLQRGANKYSPNSPTSDSPTTPAPILSPALPGESAHPVSCASLTKRSEGGSLSDQENQNSNGPRKPPTEHSQHLLTPSLDYWHRKNPLVDQIFITDVTVNMMTVTIRECKTVSGFFRHRPNSANGENAGDNSTNDVAATTEADGK